MSPNGTDTPRISIIVFMLVAVVAPMLIFAGCMKNYGRFLVDAEVSNNFRNGLVDPEFNYFYAGRDTMPYAIIAIDARYKVHSRYWISFAPESMQLKNMSENMYGKMISQPYGAHIVDPDGKTIGVWFSTVSNRSVNVDPGSRTVEILFNNPENRDRPR
jgi:hypothetical protein